MQQNSAGRIYHLDAIRAYAIFLVIFSHVFAPVCAGMNDYPLGVWWVFNLLDSVIRLCVPLFVMISGTLLLTSTKQEFAVDFLKKRLLKVVPPFIGWSFIYSYYEARMNETPFSFQQAAIDMFNGPTEFHLWFVYMIIGLYFLAPVLRLIVRSAQTRELDLRTSPVAGTHRYLFQRRQLQRLSYPRFLLVAVDQGAFGNCDLGENRRNTVHWRAGGHMSHLRGLGRSFLFIKKNSAGFSALCATNLRR